METVMQELWKNIISDKENIDQKTYVILRKKIYPLIEKEKEQLKNAFKDGVSWELYGSNNTQDERAEKYYQEIFGYNPEAGI